MDSTQMEHWYALYTKPHKERQVAGLLESEGIEVYLPTVRRQVRRRDRPDQVIYFPCYIFARFDFEITPRSSITWMPGIRRIISAGDEPVAVPDQVITLISHRLDTIDEIGYGNIRQGDPVRITSGPLRDLEAVFDRPLEASDRVRILLEVLGHLAPVEIDYSQITRI